MNNQGAGLPIANVDNYCISSLSSQILSASNEEWASGSNAFIPNQEAIDHINDAQAALRNGDTEGAQRNLDAAKKALGCSPLDPSM